MKNFISFVATVILIIVGLMLWNTGDQMMKEGHELLRIAESMR